MSLWQIPPEKVKEFRLIRRKKRTGFVGLGMSGKTVLMTAIIDRVRKMDGKTEARMFGSIRHRTGRLPPRPPDPRAFTYDPNYEALTIPNQTWPKKTLVATRCAYLHYVEGSNLLNHIYADSVAEEHTLLDFPGERLTDFALAGKSYEEWSDALLHEIADRPEYYGRAEPFFDLTESANASADDVLRAYKMVLAEFARSAIPLVTPSSFLIHPEGKYPTSLRDASPHKLSREYLAERGIVGLSESRQFTPLTKDARRVNPHLVTLFRLHFDAYRKDVCEEMAKDFYACDNLVVLVDIAAVLEGGPMAYHVTRSCIKNLLKVLDPGHTFGSYLRDLMINIITGARDGVDKIDKVAFVATKADVIHSSQRHRLDGLLSAITEDLLPPESAARWMSRRRFAVGAIQATEDGETPQKMKGWVRDQGILKTMELNYPHGLPEAWPPELRWKVGTDPDGFRFGGFAPPPLEFNGTTFWPEFGLGELVEYLGLLSV